ncbi:TetR family transcriptional regulator [Acetobacterium fimetarium]|uniref:TetR family transcriptional regulator n=1 Tax=Acetobacterium fimetarium TaxID=52691 RepID=A0ABR6WXN1_9FIRM|nr:TetR/AcrR family transcriptional regulator [Acetobacterium fimetarium]MBC3805223.1 TetR family transcriptional regulator [Acetobacterium fimetarium]
MSHSTKADLEASLKKLLLIKPFDKITISDLATDCGISRMTFYYHFKDIYDLVEWSCEEDGKRALQGKKTYQTWQEGLLQLFEAVLENKPFILNVYRSVSREQIENYLYQLTYGLLEEVVKEQARDRSITEAEMNFIAEFYKYGFVGMMLDWIKKGMSEDPNAIVDKMSTTLSGNIANSIQNFAVKHHE